MLAVLSLLAISRENVQTDSSSIQFVVRCPKDAYEGKAAVTALVYLSKRVKDPMYGPDWFNPEPCYSAKFVASAGDNLVIKANNSIGFPANLAKLEPGTYTVQAVVDRNLGGRAIASSPGNYYSTPGSSVIGGSGERSVTMDCDHLVAEQTHADTDRLKYIRFESPLLTKFYHRSTLIKAVVALPTEYAADPGVSYPTIYEVPGFGGSVDNEGEVNGLLYGTDKPGQSFVHVLLDPNVPTGHCVFADSANNGPWGTALTTEFIPYLEKQFRIMPSPKGRFVTGHSSGGWGSLWLQVSHPDFFDGVWSTSPDPVDFRDFQMIDLYKQGENMFKDEAGSPRPLAREGEKVLAYYRPFSDMERPIRGEQLGSFEAVFSPKGADGQPEKLWNRDTGKIDPAVANAWKAYDIDLILRTQWRVLGPKLAGKLHVYCGNEDTFYLDGAVRKLRVTLAALGSDASVEMFPGNHFSVMTKELRDRMDREMVDRFKGSGK